MCKNCDCNDWADAMVLPLIILAFAIASIGIASAMAYQGGKEAEAEAKIAEKAMEQGYIQTPNPENSFDTIWVKPENNTEAQNEK